MSTNSLRTVVALVLAFLLAAVGPAQAHTTAIAVDPADGAQLSTSPKSVTITFTEAPQADFAALSVVGPDGGQWTDGEPTVDGERLTVAVRELGPAGKYTIAYRVAAQDGHPITGSSTFTLLTPGNGTPGQSTNSASSSSSIPVAAGAGLAALAVLSLLVFAIRRTRRSETDNTPTA
ncbi:copper resistance protein CopC [Smaragdicoccus niigatensis]|uniref:copper resistance CopC family protein n=1 Tax=Smaragdicoccus niigatensis TaxID=359359 RepID=UPI00036428C1|nr:copper resistance CopC family protein [Smaragdicoccus niigatensis]